MRPPLSARRTLISPFRRLCVLLIIGAFATAGPAHAQGFGVFEQGTCVMARAGATVAHGGCEDGSSIYFNPSHLADTEGFTASFGATLIDASGDFTYDPLTPRATSQDQVELENDVIPVPHGYLTYGLTDKIGLGLGAYVPYGLETQWPDRLSDGSAFDGAFEGFDNQLQSFYIQPTIAYQVTPKLSVGGGPVVAISSVELNQFQDLSQQTAVENDPATDEDDILFGQLGVPFHTAFARSQLDSDNQLGIGGNIGLTYEASDRLNLGLRYTTPITVDYEGDATFEQVETGLQVPTPLQLGGQTIPAGTSFDDLVRPQFTGDGNLTEQTVETEITFPMQLVAGFSYQATPKMLLLVDYQFTGWSSFDELPLEFSRLDDRVRIENYEDTHAVRVGGQYDVLDAVSVSAGYLFNTSAVPDISVTSLLPESTRNQFTVGFGWDVTDVVEVNVSYQRLQQDDRRGRVRGTLPDEELSTDLNQGLFSFNANLVGATITLHL